MKCEEREEEEDKLRCANESMMNGINFSRYPQRVATRRLTQVQKIKFQENSFLLTIIHPMRMPNSNFFECEEIFINKVTRMKQNF